MNHCSKGSEGANSLNIKIKGMNNPHCRLIVEKELSSLDGVKIKQLDLDEKASLEFDPSKISKEEIFKAIEKAGYSAEE